MMIKLENIGKSVGKKQEVTILTDINLEVDEGEFVAIVGASGAGKSTLVNIISGIDKPTKGTYTFGGGKVETENERLFLRKNKIGLIMQNFALVDSLSALENVLLKTNDKTMTNMLMKELGILHLSKKKVSVLSGGEKQRVAIARALISGSRIIVADEPTGALDSDNAKHILDVLIDLNSKGFTIILVTHDNSLASLATRKIQMLDGKIINDSIQL